jgi:hypothetical protein
LSSAKIAASANVVSPMIGDWPRHRIWLSAVPKLGSRRARLAVVR